MSTGRRVTALLDDNVLDGSGVCVLKKSKEEAGKAGGPKVLEVVAVGVATTD